MSTSQTPDEVFLAWIRGWALTREVPPPVPHADGFRIDVGLPRQAGRYVFPHPAPTLRELGEAIVQPWMFLKACATADELRALLPPNWQMQPDGSMMTCGDASFAGSGAVAPGYTLRLDDTAARTRREIEEHTSELQSRITI